MHPIFWRFAGLAAPVGPLVAIIRTCAMTTKNLLIRAGAAAWYQVSGTRYLVPGIWYQVPGTWLVPGTCYQGTLCLVPAEMGHFFFSLKAVISETLRFLFGYLGHHFGDPGVQEDIQWTH